MIPFRFSIKFFDIGIPLPLFVSENLINTEYINYIILAEKPPIPIFISYIPIFPMLPIFISSSSTLLYTFLKNRCSHSTIKSYQRLFSPPANKLRKKPHIEQVVLEGTVGFSFM